MEKKKKSHIQVAGIIEGVKFVAGPSDNLALVDLCFIWLYFIKAEGLWFYFLNLTFLLPQQRKSPKHKLRRGTGTGAKLDFGVCTAQYWKCKVMLFVLM